MIDPEKVYRQMTPASRAMHERAVKVMPGGTTRTTTYFDPYPLYIERGVEVHGSGRMDDLELKRENAAARTSRDMASQPRA